MELIWRIFSKDARRLWWETTVALGLLIWLTWMDSWRADHMPGSIEGWLNLLLPFTWSYLIALAVLEDPLVGDRQFWVSMPCRWTSLLSSKALFAIAFIHLPYFIASAVILWARNFEPWLNPGQLMWKQFALLVALTLPALALAAVVRNIAHFMLAAVVLVAAVVFVDSPEPWMHLDPVRVGFSLAVLTVGAVGVSLFQYARRHTAMARLMGTLAVMTALAIYMWWPSEVSASLRCAASPASQGSVPFSLRVAERQGARLDSYARMNARNARLITIPVQAAGAPAAPLLTRFSHVSLEIEGNRGDVVKAVMLRPSNQFDKISLQAWLMYPEADPPWLMLTMSSELYEQLRANPVTVRGKAMVGVTRPGATVPVPVNGEIVAPGLGRCSSSFVEARMWEEMLKVHCEGPGQPPIVAEAQLTNARGMVWKNRLGGASRWAAYPRATWLSPVHRVDTFFHLVSDQQAELQGTQHQVPRSAVATSALAVMPEYPAGCTVFDYVLRDVDLNRYVRLPEK